jgi:hypothetical protein
LRIGLQQPRIQMLMLIRNQNQNQMEHRSRWMKTSRPAVGTVAYIYCSLPWFASADG